MKFICSYFDHLSGEELPEASCGEVDYVRLNIDQIDISMRKDGTLFFTDEQAEHLSDRDKVELMEIANSRKSIKFFEDGRCLKCNGDVYISSSEN
jgi:hypothetical protein